MYTFSKQLWGLHSPSTCLVQNFQIFTGDFFFHTLSTHILGFTLHTVIWFTLSKHMLGSTFLDFHERSFFHTYTLHTCFRIHSPYSYLVYTLQSHVRFNIFGFSREIIFSCLHSPHMFQVQNVQIFSGDHYCMLTLSTHVSGFTLHTVIWFTLSKHMLGSKCSNFLRRSLFHTYTLHSCFRVHSPCNCFTLSKQMLHFKILYSYYNFIMCLNAPLNHECLTP